MSKLKKYASIGVLIIAMLGLAGFGTYKYKNQPSELMEPNYYTFYKNQDTKPVGKVGIYISQMILPEKFDEEIYENVFYKPLKIIPWPIRDLLKSDDGTPMFDSVRYFEHKQFSPTHLVDHKGQSKSSKGIDYIELYKQGKIRFVEGTDAATPGYFVYAEQKANMPTRAAAFMAKARIYYHRKGAGLVDGRVPEEAAVKNLVASTMSQITSKYGDDVEWRWANAEKYSEARAAMFELLDAGVDTIVFAPPRPIMSHYEEFNASIRAGMEYIAEWEAAKNKKIKTIIAPQLANFPELRMAYLNILKDQLSAIPAGKSVKVVASIHGMPWDMASNEAWLELSKPYLAAMQSDINTMLKKEARFSRYEGIICQDYFADMTDLFQSTNKALWKGIDEKYDYVITFPIEFISENTDTLFAHAIMNFRGFTEFNVYQPINYQNWNQPLARQYMQGKTTVIYAGVPAGKYLDPLVQAHFMSIDSVLSQSLTPKIQTALNTSQAPATLKN
jgi:protoheme ferro-lyase